MKKPRKPQKKGNPMKGDVRFEIYGPPSSETMSFGYLILKPETWKRINEIAANPEKYMYDPDEYSGEAGELDVD